MTTRRRRRSRSATITFKGAAANAFAASMFRAFGDEETAKRLEENAKPAARAATKEDASDAP